MRHIRPSLHPCTWEKHETRHATLNVREEGLFGGIKSGLDVHAAVKRNIPCLYRSHPSKSSCSENESLSPDPSRGLPCTSPAPSNSLPGLALRGEDEIT